MKKEIFEKHQQVIQDYLNNFTLTEIRNKYGYKNNTYVSNILQQYNVPCKNKKWTEYQLDILKKDYPTEDWDYLVNMLFPHTKSEIVDKASRLKIHRQHYYYSDAETEILIKNYSTTTLKELKELLPNRSEYSIAVKANKLGLVSREKWSEDDINLLLLYYSEYSNSELITIYFPNRTEVSITSTANNLGLSKKYSRKEYTDEYLIIKLREFADKIGHTPFCFDLLNNPEYPSISTYARYFGSYRNACKEAGLSTHMSLFGALTNPYIALNGDVCLSRAELVISDFLTNHNIVNIKEVPYHKLINDNRCGFKRCDWLLHDNTIVEYFGLPNNEKYKIKMELKIQICKENNINLISIFESDINNLQYIFRQYI